MASEEQITPKKLESRQRKGLTLKVFILLILTNTLTFLILTPSKTGKEQKLHLPENFIKLEIRAKNYASLGEKRPLEISLYTKNFRPICQKAILLKRLSKGQWENTREGTFLIALPEKDMGVVAEQENIRIYPFSKNLASKRAKLKKKKERRYEIVF